MTSSHGRHLHFVVPDLPGPSGGSGYDRRIAAQLGEGEGWSVRVHRLTGRWPLPGPAETAVLARTLAEVPDGGLVLLDGLVAGGSPEVIEPASRRLQVVVLMHLPLADETGLTPENAADLQRREQRVLRAVAAVVVTSPWAARRLESYAVSPDKVRVVPPGADAAPLARGSLGAGGPAQLLCVAAVTPRKDQLTLIDALAGVADLPWTCTCVGPVDAAPDYVAAVRERIARYGLAHRVQLVGPRSGAALAGSYDAADLLVLVSRMETFGMVITEALARGIPAMTTSGGAAAETLGVAADGTVPGLLVPPADAESTAAALRQWLTDPALRASLAVAAQDRRGSLTTWAESAQELSAVLAAVHGSKSWPARARATGSANPRAPADDEPSAYDATAALAEGAAAGMADRHGVARRRSA